MTGTARTDELADRAHLVGGSPEQLRLVGMAAVEGAPGQHGRAEPPRGPDCRGERAVLHGGGHLYQPGLVGHCHSPSEAACWILRMVPASVFTSAARAIVPGGTSNRGKAQNCLV